MARGGRGGSSISARRSIDLTGTLSLAEKNDLIVLVTAITERMHKDMTCVFDSTPILPVPNGHDNHQWLSRSINCHKHEDKENQPPKVSQGKISQNDNSKTLDVHGHEIFETEEKGAITPQLQELKKEVSLFCRKWQQSVISRLRDLSLSDQSSAQGSFRGRDRGFKGASRGARGGRGGSTSRMATTLGTGPPRVPSQPVDRELALRWPPIPNHLWRLPLNRKKLILHLTLLLMLSLQEYSSHSRLLLVYLSTSMDIPLAVLQDDEARLARGMAQVGLDALAEFEERKATSEPKPPRKWKPGFGPPSGSTGHQHLAKPLIDVGIGSLPGVFTIPMGTVAGLLGTLAENNNLVGGLFGTNPARPTTKSMESYGREISDFAFLPLQGSHREDFVEARYLPASDRRMRLVITMSGWLMEEDDLSKAWQCLGSQAEVFAMRWETASLLNLGNSLETIVKSVAWRSVQKEMKPRTIFSSLIDSVWPVPLLKISKLMDNPWNVGMVRAEKAGTTLADAVMRSKLHGDRPISLIGYSLGARAIYACLMALAERRHFGIVENVVMMGTPAPSESRVWLTLKSVVSGRLVNVYCEDDYILGFLYRTSNIQFGVAGLQDIQGAGSVENHRVKLESGHVSYQSMVGQVLNDVGWEDLDLTQIGSEKAKKKALKTGL